MEVIPRSFGRFKQEAPPGDMVGLTRGNRPASDGRISSDRSQPSLFSMLPTLYSLADSRDHAETVVAQLQNAGVPKEHISALLLSEDPKNRPAPLSGFEYAGSGPRC